MAVLGAWLHSEATAVDKVSRSFDTVAEMADVVKAPGVWSLWELTHLHHSHLRTEIDTKPRIVILEVSA